MTIFPSRASPRTERSRNRSCSAVGSPAGSAPIGAAEGAEHLAGVAGVEEVDGRRVQTLDLRDLQALHEPRDRHPEVVADQKQALHAPAVALAKRVGERAVARASGRVEPLLKLVEDDEHFLAADTPRGAEAFKDLGQRCVGGDLGVVDPQGAEQPRLGLARRRLDVDRQHVIAEPGDQPRLDQRRLARSRRAVHQADRQPLVGCGPVELPLPEAEALGQPRAVARAGQELEEEVSVAGLEAPQPLRHDGRCLLVGREPKGAGRLAVAPVSQVVGQLGGRGVTLGRALGQALHADPRQLGRDARIDLVRRPWVAPLDLLEQVRRLRRRERAEAGEDLIQDDPQAPEVAPAVEPVDLAADLLGRHVRTRPRQLAPVVALGALVQGQAEVAQVRPADRVEQDVGRLDVAVDEAQAVRVLERPRDADQQVRGPLRRHPSGLHQGREVRPVDELLDDEHDAGFALDVVGPHDPREVELGGVAGLADEAGELLLAAEAVGPRHLQRDEAVEHRVVGEVDDGAAALAEHAADDVRAGRPGRRPRARSPGRRPPPSRSRPSGPRSRSPRSARRSGGRGGRRRGPPVRSGRGTGGGTRRRPAPRPLRGGGRPRRRSSTRAAGRARCRGR